MAVLDVGSLVSDLTGAIDITTEIQTIFDGSSEGDVLFFPPGIYLTNTLYPPFSRHYIGENATLLRPYTGSKWTKTFYFYSATALTEIPPLTTVEGFVFDGQRDIQGPYEAYELEQAHQISTYIAGTSPRLPLLIRNCEFRDCTGDAISCARNSNVTAENITTSGIFRGSITVTQDGNTLRASSITGEAFDYEADGSTDRSQIIVTDSTFKSMQFTGKYDSCVYLENVTTDYLVLNMRMGSFSAENCVIGGNPNNYYGGYSLYAQYPGHSQFKNCQIDNVSIIYNGQYFTKRGQSIAFDDCVFNSPATPGPAIYTSKHNSAVYGNAVLSLSNCTFDEDFTYVVRLEGADLYMDNIEFTGDRVTYQAIVVPSTINDIVADNEVITTFSSGSGVYT